MNKLINEIKLESKKLKEKTAEELSLLIRGVKKRAEKEQLDTLIIEWFALIQEVSSRTIGLTHYDIQLVGGLLLHQGNIVEMKTGEGKTLVSTLPVALNALCGKGVHVVTVNDYLAERDQNWMKKVYNGLDLTVGLVKSTTGLAEKQKSYKADITYVTNSELVFDFLRDCSAVNINEIVQRPYHYCLIDEIDSILIDEARTPLILSAEKKNENLNKLYFAKSIAHSLQMGAHFQLDEKKKDINLTELGYKEAKKRVGRNSLYNPEDPWILVILNALKAKYLFKRNKDYIVLKNKIVIVDEFTGRIMPDRRWSMGLHESIEIEEQMPIGGGTRTKASITYQNFFPLYPILSGMSGTAKTAEKEFQDIYKLEVRVLPTVNPLIRVDLPDFIYQTELAKWKGVLEQAKACFKRGQPILIGTATIEKSEFLSELLTISQIPHTTLNAKPQNVARESEIVAQAGARFAVTIATNMAGRGTDIILGGNPNFIAKQTLREFLKGTNVHTDKTIDASIREKIRADYNPYPSKLEKDIENLPYSIDVCQKTLKDLYQEIEQKIYASWKNENQLVKDLGGLFVLGTERHETRRIDNQLRGRAGRQGDPGASQFFVSLEDDLIKIFGGGNIQRWVQYFLQDESIPLESSLLTKSLETAQKKVEVANYEIRKNIFQYDDILNLQRTLFVKARQEFLDARVHKDSFLRYLEYLMSETKQVQVSDIPIEIEKWVENSSNLLKKKRPLFKEHIWISNDLRVAESNFFQKNFLKSNRTIDMLGIADFSWSDHLDRMSFIRDTISWRSYGQQNPLVEYNNEGIESFKVMLDQIRSGMLYYYFKSPLNYS